MSRLVALYLATLVVFLPVDFLFLGLVAKGFFQTQVGDMLGPVRPAPAILFYLIYIGGIVFFVSSGDVSKGAVLLRGALFGLVCYATFELTSMSLLRHWTWPVVALDIGWGVVLTACASVAGAWIADRFTA